ncbi:hypothetical protein D3C72_1877160 [compost metagenome]
MTQAFSGRSLDVTVKIEHEDPRFVFGGFLLLLLRLGLLLAQGLELGFVQQAAFQALAQVLVELVELVDLQLAARLAPAFATQTGNRRKNNQNRDHQGRGLGEKACVLCKKLHSNSLTCRRPNGANR